MHGPRGIYGIATPATVNAIERIARTLIDRKLRTHYVDISLGHILRVDRKIEQLKLSGSEFIPVTAKGSVFGTGAFGTSFNRDASFFQKFSLGGPFRLGAFSRDEFLGNHYAYASVGYRYELFRLPVLVGKKVYAIGAFESGSAFDDFGRMTAHHSINIGALAETILGPVALAGSVSPTGRTKVNFSIGRLF